LSALANSVATDLLEAPLSATERLTVALDHLKAAGQQVGAAVPTSEGEARRLCGLSESLDCLTVQATRTLELLVRGGR
jgi:hypothetical protein